MIHSVNAGWQRSAHSAWCERPSISVTATPTVSPVSSSMKPFFREHTVRRVSDRVELREAAGNIVKSAGQHSVELVLGR
jgi:hypothetical protein